MATKKAKSGGGRKIGRAGRKPAHQRYNLERRWEKNKARKIAKQKRFEEKKRISKGR
jgi:hypothetical protein